MFLSQNLRIIPTLGRDLSSTQQKDLLRNKIIKELERNHFDSNDDSEEKNDYDNLTPKITTINSNNVDEESMLIKTILSADSISLDLSLKWMNHRLDLTKIVSKEHGYTLLHWAVFKDSDHIVYSLWKYIMDNQSEPLEVKKRKIKMWINKKTEGKEGFTALHFASFNGNLSIIRFLERHGADVYAENNYGMNWLHVAAQGNQPSSIVYFVNKNLNINSKDNIKCTPFHWACYAGAENSSCYLIAYGADPNLQDLDGFTPLHLAVKSAENIKSSRIVKQLLFWGADRNIKTNEGMKAIDLCSNILIGHIAHDLRKALAEPRYCSWLLLSQPLTKMRKEPYTALYFLFLIILSFWLLMLFIYPVLNDIVWIASTWTVYFLMMVFWSLSTFRDPGYLKKSDKIEFITLVERYEPGWLCPKCNVIRTPRSRHWNIWDKWVERFDHHCPWINNWIGTRNHGPFLIFLIFTYIMLSIVIVQVAINFSVIDDYDVRRISQTQYIGFLIPEYIINSKVVYKGICSILLIFSSFFWLLMNILLFTQIMNFLLNQTMNERYGGSKKSLNLNNSDEKSFNNDDDRAVLIQNASIDSTLANKNKSKWENFWLMMRGSESKDQYKLFLESMRRIGTSAFESILNNKQFY